jgi:hypothetical protein
MKMRQRKNVSDHITSARTGSFGKRFAPTNRARTGKTKQGD